MRRRILFTALVFAGCVRAPSRPADDAASLETTSVASGDADPSTEASPRTIVARGHGAEITLIEGPGFLVDGNAPPPPPGSTPTRYEAFHGSCIGETRGCSIAGGIVRSSSTFDGASATLAEAGFDLASR